LRGTLIEPPGDIARSARMPRRADTPPWEQRVRLIYLLDAIAEAALVAAWLVRTPRDHRR